VGLLRFDDPAAMRFAAGRVPEDHANRPKAAVMRSDRLEVAKGVFEPGEGASHAHPEEQVLYVLEGRLLVWLGDEPPYEVGPGEGSFHPANVEHRVEALERTTTISLKDVVDPAYHEHGALT